MHACVHVSSCKLPRGLQQIIVHTIKSTKKYKSLLPPPALSRQAEGRGGTASVERTAVEWLLLKQRTQSRSRQRPDAIIRLVDFDVPLVVLAQRLEPFV